jgi:hypothetical protein
MSVFMFEWVQCWYYSCQGFTMYTIEPTSDVTIYVHAKFHDDRLWHSNDIKGITETIADAPVGWSNVKWNSAILYYNLNHG